MIKKIKEWKIEFPYLVDETQKVARTFKAQCTPDLYLFDAHQKLVYHGRLDDNWQDEKKVKRQVLTYPEFKEDTHLLKNAETRFLPKEYIKSPVLINIFGDSVAQLLWLNPVVIIVVKNKEMAEGYRDYFKLLWNKSH